MKQLILLSTLASFLILANPYSYSQSVGINGSGSNPNSSALLDIDAAGMTQKGLLIPRIALTSATDAATIATPATSLLVYNTGAGALIPAGYYYNQGTSGSPNWVPFLTNNVNAPAAWSLTGNTGTTGGPNFLGTKDNISLRFRTNNTQKMIIDSLGNLGIGITSPNYKLNVVDSDKDVAVSVENWSSTAARYPKVQVANYSGGFSSSCPIFQAVTYRGNSGTPTAVQNGDALGAIAFTGGTGVGYSSSWAAVVRAYATENFTATANGTAIQFETIANGTTASTPRMYITNAGNVGIATPSPLTNFQIGGSAERFLSVGMSGGTDTYCGYIACNAIIDQSVTPHTFKKASSYDIAGGIIAIGASTAGIQMQAFDAGTTAVTSTAWNPQFTLRPSGKVGIGTAAPSAQFHVIDLTASVGAYQQILQGANGGYGAGISFQSILTGGTLLEMARITADASGAWTTTASTQDAGLRFYTANDGTTTERVRINNLGAVSFYNYGAGTLTTDASGNITAASDERLKNIEGSFTRGLSEIRKINPILYKWKASSKLDTTTTYAGFSAQNIKSVIPEAIGISPDGYYTFQDRPVEAALVNAVKELDKRTEVAQKESFITNSLLQELNAEIKMLKKTIDTLESENKNLQISSEMRISKLEKMIQTTNKEEAKK